MELSQIIGTISVNRVYYMSAHVLLNLLNKLRKRDKNVRLAEHFISFFATSLINSIIHENEY